MENEKQEIRIKGVTPKLHNDLNNISDNLGVTMSSLVKQKLWEIVKSYPEEMKTPPKKD